METRLGKICAIAMLAAASFLPLKANAETRKITNLIELEEQILLDYQHAASVNLSDGTRNFRIGCIVDLGDYHFNAEGRSKYDAKGEVNGWRASLFTSKVGIEADNTLGEKPENGNYGLSALIRGNGLRVGIYGGQLGARYFRGAQTGDNLFNDIEISGNDLLEDKRDLTLKLDGFYLGPKAKEARAIPFWSFAKSLTSKGRYEVLLGGALSQGKVTVFGMASTENLPHFTPEIKFKYAF